MKSYVIYYLLAIRYDDAVKSAIKTIFHKTIVTICYYKKKKQIYNICYIHTDKDISMSEILNTNSHREYNDLEIDSNRPNNVVIIIGNVLYRFVKLLFFMLYDFTTQRSRENVHYIKWKKKNLNIRYKYLHVRLQAYIDSRHKMREIVFIFFHDDIIKVRRI